MEDDQRIVAQARPVQRGDKLADPFVHGGDLAGVVAPPLVLDVLIFLKPCRRRLIGRVWSGEGEIEEQG